MIERTIGIAIAMFLRNSEEVKEINSCKCHLHKLDDDEHHIEIKQFSEE